MSLISPPLQIRYEGYQYSASIGNLKIREDYFSIEKASNDDTSSILVIENQNIQQAIRGGLYIRLYDATRFTGLSDKQLRDLCQNGLIEVIPKENDWLIKLESLQMYCKRYEL